MPFTLFWLLWLIQAELVFSLRSRNENTEDPRELVYREAKPANYWGSYQAYPSELKYVNDKYFPKPFQKYLDSGEAETECKVDTAEVIRIYRNYWSIENNKYLFSLYCKSIGAEEHALITEDRETREVNVTEVHKSLKNFGFDIDQTKTYKAEIPEEEGRELTKNLLLYLEIREALDDENRETKNRTCPNYGLETYYDLKTKVENALTYYRFPISCKVHPRSYFSTHMTYIEVVQDKSEQAKYYGGDPIVAVIEYHVPNSKYLTLKANELEQEANRLHDEADVQQFLKADLERRASILFTDAERFKDLQSWTKGNATLEYQKADELEQEADRLEYGHKDIVGDYRDKAKEIRSYAEENEKKSNEYESRYLESVTEAQKLTDEAKVAGTKHEDLKWQAIHAERYAAEYRHDLSLL